MQEKLYLKALRKANIFNMYCEFVIAILGLFTLLFNELGIFTADKVIMRYSMIILFFGASLPLIIYLIHDKALKNEKSVLERKWFKIIIIIIAYFAIFDLNASFSFHAIPVLVVPTLMTAQYKNSKRMTIITYILSIVLVIISIYASYIFGQYDANLLKPLTEEEASSIKNRLDILFTKRFLIVFLHYCLPLIIGVTAIDFIGFSITKRNENMINEQIELSNKIQDEIMAKARMQNNVIEDLADVIESRDIETGEHIKRTKEYVTILVNKMKEKDQYKNYLDDKTIDQIINASPLHDIGKITVSDLILCKPGKLTDEEFEKMKLHTIKGGEIIDNILDDLGDDDFLKIAYEIALYHHEKWNGKGYPKGLKETEIPLPARIMAIADVFDALVAERVYKKPMPIDKAINIIIEDSGTHFDPDLVEIFKDSIDEFKKVAEHKYE
ncbi:MAG: HD domain-containing protein [Acholeplasmatales bacterium]|nr:HD domain-containing protein [Acholeplasmatales bacterium]